MWYATFKNPQTELHCNSVSVLLFFFFAPQPELPSHSSTHRCRQIQSAWYFTVILLSTLSSRFRETTAGWNKSMIQLYSKQGVYIKHLLVPLIRSTLCSSHPAAYIPDCRERKRNRPCLICARCHTRWVINTLCLGVISAQSWSFWSGYVCRYIKPVINRLWRWGSRYSSSSSSSSSCDDGARDRVKWLGFIIFSRLRARPWLD